MANGKQHFIITILLGTLLFTHPAYAGDVMVGLAIDSLSWADDEFISSGQITVHGGSIVSASNPLGNLVSSIKNDPESATSILTVFYVQPSGSIPNKSHQLTLSHDWFVVKTAKTSAACPSSECPIEIEGNLVFEHYVNDEPVVSRKVSITTSDFILTDRPEQ